LLPSTQHLTFPFLPPLLPHHPHLLTPCPLFIHTFGPLGVFGCTHYLWDIWDTDSHSLHVTCLCMPCTIPFPHPLGPLLHHAFTTPPRDSALPAIQERPSCCAHTPRPSGSTLRRFTIGRTPRQRRQACHTAHPHPTPCTTASRTHLPQGRAGHLTCHPCLPAICQPPHAATTTPALPILPTLP